MSALDDAMSLTNSVAAYNKKQGRLAALREVREMIEERQNEWYGVTSAAADELKRIADFIDAMIAKEER